MAGKGNLTKAGLGGWFPFLAAVQVSDHACCNKELPMTSLFKLVSCLETEAAVPAI